MEGDVGRLRTLRAVSSRISGGRDATETLALTLEAFCRETRWFGAVVMQADARDGVVRVLARHEPARLGPVRRERPWPLAESPVQRVLATGAPVVLRDAQAVRQYPGYRSESRAQGFRTVVLLPVLSGPGEGDGLVLAASSRRVEDLSEGDLAFLETIVHLGSVAFQNARLLEAEQARAVEQAAIASRNEGLLDRVLAGDPLATVLAMVADGLDDPFVVVDLETRRVFGLKSPWPDLLDDGAWSSALDGELQSAFLAVARSSAAGARTGTREIAVRLKGRSARRPAIVRPLEIDGILVAALVVFCATEHDPEIDHRIEGARLAICTSMLRAHSRAAADARNVSSVLADLLGGTGRVDDVTERAQRVGMAPLGGPAALLAIAVCDPGAVAGPVGVEALRAAVDIVRPHRGWSAAMIDGLVVLHGPAAPRDGALWTSLTPRVLDEIRTATGRDHLGVRSGVCLSVPDYPPAFRDCRCIIELGRRLGRTGEVAGTDFGPLPVLMSAVDRGAMTDFVQGAIGKVALHDRHRGTAYLSTLAAYLDRGGRAQVCADALGLHVTTLRYRLSRLRELFGLAFDTPDDRFTLQLALRFQFVLTDLRQPESKRLGKSRARPST